MKTPTILATILAAALLAGCATVDTSAVPVESPRVCAHRGGRYEYDGKIYTSPTAVVRAITGKAHYNGVVWWGLRKLAQQERKDQ